MPVQIRDACVRGPQISRPIVIRDSGRHRPKSGLETKDHANHGAAPATHLTGGISQ